MTEVQFYGYGLPGFKKKQLPGKLVVLEGTDGVGRSTQIALLREWLESEGYAVAATGLKRGKLAGKAIQQAMQGHTLGDTTMNLSYATDFADRLERDIIPALRASFVVLIDRYIYSIFARAQVRGADPLWIRNLLSFALIPDKVFYLHADLNKLIPRVLNARGFDYWESGMDFLGIKDYYKSFTEYQTRLLVQFEAMVDEFGFVRVDANQSIREVYRALRGEIEELIKDMKPPKRKKKEKKDREAEEKKPKSKKSEKDEAESKAKQEAKDKPKAKKEEKKGN